MRRFVRIDLGREPVPDRATLCRSRHLLERHKLEPALFEPTHGHAAERGLRLSAGTIVDATIIHAPIPGSGPGTWLDEEPAKARDPELQQTRQGNQRYFGMKAWTAGARSSTRWWRRQPTWRTGLCRPICCTVMEHEHGATRRIAGSAP